MAQLTIRDVPEETLAVLVPTAPLAEQALQLAFGFRRPAYDCFYVALALRQSCPLVTADRSLFNAVGPAVSNVRLLEQLGPDLP